MAQTTSVKSAAPPVSVPVPVLAAVSKSAGGDKLDSTPISDRNELFGLVSILRAMDIRSILPPVTHTCTLATPVTAVLRTLATHNILSMPVVSSSTDSCEFVGFIGMTELVEFVTTIVPNPSTWAYDADSKDIDIDAWNAATVKTVFDAIVADSKRTQQRDAYSITCPVIAEQSYVPTVSASPPAAVTTANASASAFGTPKDAKSVVASKDATTSPAAAAADTGISVWQVLEVMASRGLRRLCVLSGGANGSKSRVRGIVSQSMLIRVLRDLIEQFGAAQHQSIGLLAPVIVHTGRVQTTKYTDPAISAFLSIIRAGVQGLAVTDESGAIIDVISVRDLKALSKRAVRSFPLSPKTNETAVTAAAAAAPEASTAGKASDGESESGAVSVVRLLELWRPVSDFLLDARAGSVASSKEPVFGTHELLPSDSLKTALIMLADDNVHRLFVVKSFVKPVPVSVITQTDVLTAVLALCRK